MNSLGGQTPEMPRINLMMKTPNQILVNSEGNKKDTLGATSILKNDFYGEEGEIQKKPKVKGQNPQQKDKEFYKAMQKIKDRNVD